MPKFSNRPFGDDTSPEAEQFLIEMLRKKTPAEKLRMVDQLWELKNNLARSGIRLRHPNASDGEVQRRLADIILGKELAEKVYGANIFLQEEESQ